MAKLKEFEVADLNLGGQKFSEALWRQLALKGINVHLERSSTNRRRLEAQRDFGNLIEEQSLLAAIQPLVDVLKPLNCRMKIHLARRHHRPWLQSYHHMKKIKVVGTITHSA